MKKKGNKGLSTIVVTLILIVLALVAVGAVWIVVSNLLKGQSDEVSLNKLNFNAEINSLSLDNSWNNVSFNVERKVGEANFVGMKFYFYNETGTEVITEYFTLTELAQKRFSFHLNMNLSNLNKISIVPIFKTDDEKDNLGNVADSYDVKKGEHITISSGNNSTCAPTTCSALGYTCGSYANGTCSGTLNCGTCSGGSTCVSGACQNISSLEFPVGVWMQQPTFEINSVSIAKHYKDIGINTFVGLWLWPREDWAWPGYTVQTAALLKNYSMKAYAGEEPNATIWINAHPEFDSTIIGYILGDEPDMNRDSGVPEQAAANTPLAWKAKGDLLIAADSSRPIYANFGKPFAKDSWYGNENGQTGSKESDFGYYMSPTDIVSSDFYGITDPYEQTSNHGIWTYGRAVTNTIKYAGSRPVLGFLEVSAPWYDGDGSQSQLYTMMQPSLINPIVWNLVVHGASGIIYFCHTFSNSVITLYSLRDYSGGSTFTPLLIPEMKEAMNATNKEIQSYANVLLSPTISGTTSNTTGVNVTTLTKNYGGATYIFAMGDGDSGHINGQVVDATITVSGAGTKTVRVLNENNRTILMTNSRFTDHFDAYEVHIYHFQ
jgi:hypothetical protein